MVTDEGTIVYQTENYEFNVSGSRTTLFDGTVSLTGIWGADPSDFFVVGYMEKALMRCSHDPVTGDFTIVVIDDLEFPADKALDPGPTVDKFGRPLY